MRKYGILHPSGRVTDIIRNLATVTVNRDTHYPDATVIPVDGALPDAEPDDILILVDGLVIVEQGNRETVIAAQADEAEIAAEMRAMAVERIQGRNPDFVPPSRKIK